MIVVGFMVERRARGGITNYFLGGKACHGGCSACRTLRRCSTSPARSGWSSLLYVYGLKSVFIPWLWPVFNQIFLMVYLSVWLRRSGAMTGAEWITMRFGRDAGAEASRFSVVLFALVSVIAFTGYAFVGIAKFSEIFLPEPIVHAEYVCRDHCRHHDTVHRRGRAIQRRADRSDSVLDHDRLQLCDRA